MTHISQQNDTASYSSAFNAFLPDRVTEPQWLNSIRRDAFSLFQTEGFPSRNNEEWRFTPLNQVKETGYSRPEPVEHPSLEAIESLTGYSKTGPQLVFINGVYAPELSRNAIQTKGVQIGSISELLQSNDEILQPHLAQLASQTATPFVSLHNSFMEDGAAVILDANTQLSEPVTILYVTPSEQPIFMVPHTLVVAGRSSHASVVEVFASTMGANYFSIPVTEFAIGENSDIRHVRLNMEASNAAHISYTHAEIQRDAIFASHNVCLGGELTRNDFYAGLSGENIHCTLNGVYLGSGKQIIDNHTSIDHAMPHCESHELYKGILDGESQGVFNGKIFVRLDAQKTDAKQTSQVVLLSDLARVNSKPQLEIFADDVKCTHGATIGQISKEALFYLRSRGLSKTDAMAMLIQAFVADVIVRIPISELADDLNAMLPELLERK